MTVGEYWYEVPLGSTIGSEKGNRFREERLRFVHAPQGSGYMELSLPCLNQTWLGEEEQPEDINIEVNTYYRFL